MSTRIKKQSQPRLLFSSLALLTAFMLSGCNPDDGTSSNLDPTPIPTSTPTSTPTTAPTTAPTSAPTSAPTTVPTTVPTTAPTTAPTMAPTTVPTTIPDSNRLLPKHWHETGGYGTDIQAGLGGKVYKVTNLNKSGAGSLGEAISASGERLVVFEVGGVIDLEGEGYTVKNGHITIAGETAPSPGITLVRGNFVVDADDVVVSHITVQYGTFPGKEGDAANNYGDGVVFNHVSIYWAVDENLSMSPAHNTTIYKSIIAEGLSCGNHEDGEHSKGSLIYKGTDNLSLIGTLYVHNALRNPRAGETEIVISNGVVYNWAPGWDHVGPVPKKPCVPTDDWFNYVVSLGNSTLAFEGNVGIQGPESVGEYFVSGHQSAKGKAWMNDNIIVDPSGKPLKIYGKGITPLDSRPFWPSGLVSMPAHEALYEVLRTAGARPGDRDSHNARVIGNVANGDGMIIDSQDEVGGYANYAPTRHTLSVPDGFQARRAWLDEMEDAIAVDRNVDLSRLYNMVGSVASDRLSNGIDNSTGNRPPVAKIGAVTQKMPGQTVMLDGSASSDPDADGLSYLWTQIEGESITLAGNSNPTLSFIAPTVTQPKQYTFTLTVNDGELSNVARVTVLVSPLASAGLCDTATEGNSLTLNCPSGQVITGINFASYGNPSGSCGSFSTGSCSASNSLSVVSAACKGKSGCTVYAGNDKFGDPCYGTAKKLAAQVACGATDTNPATSQVPNQNPNPNPNSNPVKIMPVGDSITAGEHFHEPVNEERKGYRRDLYWMLTRGGYNVDFVGSQKHGERPQSDPEWYDWNAEGYPGGGIVDVSDHVKSALPKYKPDILLVHLGTNRTDWSSKPDQVMDMLNIMNDFSVRNDHPMTVFLCKIINQLKGQNTSVTQFNNKVADLVAKRTGDKIKIILVDMENGAGLDYSDAPPNLAANPPYPGGDMWGNTYPGISNDTKHPNDRGNTKMAEKFFEELIKEL